MIFWFVTVIIVMAIMFVISSLIHDKYHKKNAIGTCHYCGQINCTDDHHTVYMGAGSCPLYTNSFPYWAVRIVVLLAIFSPMFLEFNKLGVISTSYRFENGKYERIRLVALDVPGISKILNVPNSANIYAASQIIVRSGSKIRIFAPRFTWQYDQNPEVFGEIPNRLTFTRQENKPILEFILRNESVLRAMISNADINNSSGEAKLLGEMRKLVKADINVHGYKFDLADFIVYEY